VDNRDWLATWTLLDYLRDIGKHFTIASMLEKDSVQLRLGSGLSFTEFSYMTLQAADFLQLHQAAGVEIFRMQRPETHAASRSPLYPRGRRRPKCKV